jgi:hypothetical protein
MTEIKEYVMFYGFRNLEEFQEAIGSIVAECIHQLTGNKECVHVFGRTIDRDSASNLVINYNDIMALAKSYCFVYGEEYFCQMMIFVDGDIVRVGIHGLFDATFKDGKARILSFEDGYCKIICEELKGGSFCIYN